MLNNSTISTRYHLHLPEKWYIQPDSISGIETVKLRRARRERNSLNPMPTRELSSSDRTIVELRETGGGWMALVVD